VKYGQYSLPLCYDDRHVNQLCAEIQYNCDRLPPMEANYANACLIHSALETAVDTGRQEWEHECASCDRTRDPLSYEEARLQDLVSMAFEAVTKEAHLDALRKVKETVEGLLSTQRSGLHGRKSKGVKRVHVSLAVTPKGDWNAGGNTDQHAKNDNLAVMGLPFVDKPQAVVHRFEFDVEVPEEEECPVIAPLTEEESDDVFPF
jgi:hypothetical protein